MSGDKELRYFKLCLSRIRTQIVDNLNKAPGSEIILKLETLINEFSDIKTDYFRLNKKLVLEIDNTDKDADVKEQNLMKEADEVRDVFCTLNAKVKEYQMSVHKNVSSESIPITNSLDNLLVSQPKLPKIEIPKFNGDIRKFIDFKNLFKSLVHDNPEIPNIQKLYFLKSSLIEEAASLVTDVELSDAAYSETWTALCERFENKRSIIKAHLVDLFNLTKIKSELGIRSLLDESNRALRGLTVAGENTESWSTLLSFLIATKLDDSTKKDWENLVVDNSRYPPYNELKKFLEHRAFTVEDRQIDTGKSKPFDEKSGKISFGKNTFRKIDSYYKKSLVVTIWKCCACDGSHKLLDCENFLQMSPIDRYNLIRSTRLCLNCFGTGHIAAYCQSLRCKKCCQKHNTLLHFGNRNHFTTANPATNEAYQKQLSERKNFDASSQSPQARSKVVLLPTATVSFCCGREVGKARILVDTGSQATLISETFVRKYHLPSEDTVHSTILTGVGGQTINCNGTCSLTLGSKFNDFTLDIVCDIAPSTAFSYEISTTAISWLNSKLPTVDLAEEPLSDSKVDIIIGAEYIEKFLQNKTLAVDSVVLRNSQFGWMTTGYLYLGNKVSEITTECCQTITSIKKKLRKYWEIEEVKGLILDYPDKEGSVHMDDARTSGGSVRRTSARMGSPLPNEPQVHPGGVCHMIN